MRAHHCGSGISQTLSVHHCASGICHSGGEISQTLSAHLNGSGISQTLSDHLCRSGFSQTLSAHLCGSGICQTLSDHLCGGGISPTLSAHLCGREMSLTLWVVATIGRHVYGGEQCIARISVGPTFDIGPTLAFDVHAVSKLTYKLATLRGNNGIGTPRGSKEVVDLYCIFIYGRQRESDARQ